MKTLKISIEFIRSIAANIIGGFIAAVIFSFCQVIAKKYQAFRIKKILGPDAGRNKVIHVFYPSFKLPHDVWGRGAASLYTEALLEFASTNCSHGGSEKCIKKNKNYNTINDENPLIPGKAKSIMIKNLMKDDPVSQSEVRAIGYLNTFFSKIPGKMEICSDINEPIIRPYELSQISLGEWNTNIRTINILRLEENRFIKIESNGIGILKEDGKFEPFPREKAKNGSYDYGIILRLTVERKEKKVWIACTGLSRWGTSGAAYFLANNWKKLFMASLTWWQRILLFPRVKDFAAIIKVRKGRDDSAELVEFIDPSARGD